MTRRFLLSLLILSVLSVCLVGCKSSRHATSRARWEQKSSPKPKKKPTLPKPDRSKPDGKLVAEAESWLGVPYKYGGNDRGGVDCSGLVLQVYLRALDIPLPRNSKAQWEYCTPTKVSDLHPGDLIFFATGKDKNRVSHVGIFIGRDQMIHSSTTQGVTTADISSPYFKKTLIGAGYVGAYHKMLSEKKPKEKKEPKKKEKKEKVELPEKPATEPVPEVQNVQAVAPVEPVKEVEPIKAVEPVEPVKEEAPVKPKEPVEPVKAVEPVEPAKSVPPVVPVAPVSPITPVTTTQPSPAEPEPTTEDARNSVLSNLIEKKLTPQE